eukprot:TRINITY_DN5849_c0_g3_i1.p6 TRINITY_DN5849_c0_g3~~TRINITY_DN5849_c0_g3_i1.p6  ORF type:complete len:101 (-),score=17.04 TRINITY_DN5849_c0_g3_i1:512-814(-)
MSLEWARQYLRRRKWCRRHISSAAVVSPEEIEKKRQELVRNIQEVSERLGITYEECILNVDQTMLPFALHSNYCWAEPHLEKAARGTTGLRWRRKGFENT